jgi:hypothetical protein
MTLILMLLMAQAVGGGCDMQSRAEFRMHVWMNKLALSDWKIALQVVDAATLPAGEMGHSRMVLPEKTATISIPDRWPIGNYALPCEWQVDLAEAGVVHELVHVRLAEAFGGERTEQSKYAEELAVKALTAVLLEAIHTYRSSIAAEHVRSPLPSAEWIKVVQERDARERVASGQNEYLKSEPKH